MHTYTRAHPYTPAHIHSRAFSVKETRAHIAYIVGVFLTHTRTHTYRQAHVYIYVFVRPPACTHPILYTHPHRHYLPCIYMHIRTPTHLLRVSYTITHYTRITYRPYEFATSQFLCDNILNTFILIMLLLR